MLLVCIFIHVIFFRKRAIHARFFSKERKGDIPWNIDVVLRVNGMAVDIQKVFIFIYYNLLQFIIITYFI